MNRFKVLIAFALILIITGCNDFFMICSLNPFYLDKNVVLMHEMEGTWNANAWPTKNASGENVKAPVWKKLDTTLYWKIDRFLLKETLKTKGGKDSTVLKPMSGYTVKLINPQTDSSIYQFKMVLFRVNKILYADFTPDANSVLENSLFATENYFTVHTLARIVRHNKQIDISWLGAEYMKDMIERKRVRVNYRWVESASRLLLTGSPEQLTGMIDLYAGEKRFIDWDNQPAMLTLKRIK